MIDDTNPPKPTELSVKLKPKYFGIISEPCPAGIISPSVLMRLRRSSIRLLESSPSLDGLSWFSEGELILSLGLHLRFVVVNSIIVSVQISECEDESWQERNKPESLTNLSVSFGILLNNLNGGQDGDIVKEPSLNISTTSRIGNPIEWCRYR